VEEVEVGEHLILMNQEEVVVEVEEAVVVASLILLSSMGEVEVVEVEVSHKNY